MFGVSSVSFIVSSGFCSLIIGGILPLFAEVLVSVRSSLERLVASLGCVWFFGIEVAGEGFTT